MAFAEFPDCSRSIHLLQRSLRQGRLGHAYLFSGNDLTGLETVARTLAKTLNCVGPVQSSGSEPRVDSCDECSSCQRIDRFIHPDVLWIRPESKLRAITISQIREVMHAVNLKPTEARWKVAIIAGADRLNVQAANAFLKTLEEPPARSVLLLLATEPQRLLETILSRCLRLNFASSSDERVKRAHQPWLAEFAALAARPQSSLLGRYQLLGRLLERLAQIRSAVQEEVTARSPLQSHDDIDPALREKWESELNAAVEAEYRRQRSEVLDALHWWLRDVWVNAHSGVAELLGLPDLASPVGAIARRVSSNSALENLQSWEETRRLLDTNVQEALALEVGMLKLQL
jgi:DNA polymerase III subunit delta'